uniref:Integrin subunit alpha 7 n=1 Tax=Gopherus evgoodei TaxID=1825980 RepID=A0A8C4W3X9_9SAUR
MAGASQLLQPLLLAGAAFNLDGTDPLLKDGAGGSLFGFSVALHRQLRPEPASWMLVGAPQALALPGQKANRTGGLYACPLTREIDDCWRVPIDEGGTVDLHKESKENQWLGVSVKSQGAGGKIVTCAHLYESRNRVNQPLETRDVIGRCYVLSQDLTVSEELDGGEWKFCEGRPQGHDRFGFCQQGVSAGFTADKHYILFGAPGTYNWKGDLRVELVNQSSLELVTYDDGPYEAGGEKDQDPSLIPVPANSYFGFSIDSGKGLTRQDQLSFVTGAPRANHTGAVVILRRDNVNRLVPEVVLPGEQLTSSFGYAVAVVDLNSDGWMDLVVGAPHFFDRQEEIGGAAYVYINQAGRWADIRPIRLNGTSHSMFGIGLTALGDLNQDGFQDIAVGAPFDGAGKVFIYHGSSLGIVTKPAQVLDGEGVGVRTFGYSLSGGLDVDGNLYPDLLVGSLSDSVVLYRWALPAAPPAPSRLPGPEAHGPRTPVLGRGGAAPPARPLLRQGHLPAAGGSCCPSPALPYPRPATGSPPAPSLQESIRDKLRPIVVMLTYSIKHAQSKSQVQAAALPPLMPVLNAQLPNSQRVNFLKQGCGEDKICQSNLQLRYQFCSRVGDADFLPLDADGTAVFAMSDQKDVALEIQVTNLPSDPAAPQRDGDDAHEALLTATFPEALPYSGVRAHDMWAGPGLEKQPCLPNLNGSQVQCELGNPMKRGAQVGISPPNSWPQPPHCAQSSLPLAAPHTAPRPRCVCVAFDPAPQTQTGECLPPQVSNRGQSLNTLGSAFLNLMWPHEIANGKWLLYPLRLELAARPGQRVACSPAANPLRLALESHGQDRSRREAERPEVPSTGPWWHRAHSERKNVTLDCAQGTARCLVFRCPLHSFDRSAVLTAWGRLWNSTFLEVSRRLGQPALGWAAGPSRCCTAAVVARGVPWWIILIAVLAGVLVLGLLVSILWKVRAGGRGEPATLVLAVGLCSRTDVRPGIGPLPPTAPSNTPSPCTPWGSEPQAGTLFPQPPPAPLPPPGT